MELLSLKSCFRAKKRPKLTQIKIVVKEIKIASDITSNIFIIAFAYYLFSVFFAGFVSNKKYSIGFAIVIIL